MITEKRYSNDRNQYKQKTVRERIEALLLNNLGLIVTREQILQVAKDPVTGKPYENWHQRLSELRTDYGYTILTNRDVSMLKPQEYLMLTSDRRDTAARRVLPSASCWKQILENSGNRCQWAEDGQACQLENGHIDPIGGGTVKLTADHMQPHSLNPKADPNDPSKWQALCGRHQVMKKNFWDSSTGKINLVALIQSSSSTDKRVVFEMLKKYFNE